MGIHTYILHTHALTSFWISFLHPASFTRMRIISPLPLYAAAISAWSCSCVYSKYTVASAWDYLSVCVCLLEWVHLYANNHVYCDCAGILQVSGVIRCIPNENSLVYKHLTMSNILGSTLHSCTKALTATMLSHKAAWWSAVMPPCKETGLEALMTLCQNGAHLDNRLHWSK